MSGAWMRSERPQKFQYHRSHHTFPTKSCLKPTSIGDDTHAAAGPMVHTVYEANVKDEARLQSSLAGSRKIHQRKFWHARTITPSKTKKPPPWIV
jgi:hypothetical protein